jgi:hypothetical protein
MSDNFLPLYHLCKYYISSADGLAITNGSFTLSIYQYAFAGLGSVVAAAKIRVTRLGKISPLGQFFMALGEFFSRKNSPMIWAKF